VLVEIESHICVPQACLDLPAPGLGVYAIVDGVSSCSQQEVPVALERMRREGAVVTTSESSMHEITRDANISE